MNKKEKVFVISSIVIIALIICCYAYRTIHYYRELNKPPKAGVKLVEVLKNNIEYINDGLYEENGFYYYKGKNVKNYALYSGKLYRIVSISDSIRLIEDEPIIMSNYNNNLNFSSSSIYKYLNNEYLNSLNKDGLIEKEYCNENLNIEDYNCKETINSYVGLLSLNEYIKANATESYLNTNAYYWLLNISENNSPYYIHSMGGANNTNINYYGVRPVIDVKSDLDYIAGNGTKTDPYILEANENVYISDNYIGSYVKYNDMVFRISSKNENSVSLILDDYIKGEENYIKSDYYKIDNYLNEFIEGFKKEDLYLENNKYIRLPNVKDNYVLTYPYSWLTDKVGNSLSYVITEQSTLYLDSNTSLNYIRPIINVRNDLIIVQGNGTKENPLVVGETNEKVN